MPTCGGKQLFCREGVRGLGGLSSRLTWTGRWKVSLVRHLGVALTSFKAGFLAFISLWSQASGVGLFRKWGEYPLSLVCWCLPTGLIWWQPGNSRRKLTCMACARQNRLSPCTSSSAPSARTYPLRCPLRLLAKIRRRNKPARDVRFPVLFLRATLDNIRTVRCGFASLLLPLLSRTPAAGQAAATRGSGSARARRCHWTGLVGVHHSTHGSRARGAGHVRGWGE